MDTCLRSGLEQPKLEDLCCLATGAFPHSGPLWLLRLKCCSCRVGVGPEEALALFRQSVQLVPVSCLSAASEEGPPLSLLQSCAELWEAWLQFCAACSLPAKEVVEVSVHERSVHGWITAPPCGQLARQSAHQPVQSQVSVKYLEWTLLSEGIAAVRRTYQRPVDHALPCLDWMQHTLDIHPWLGVQVVGWVSCGPGCDLVLCQDGARRGPT